MNIPARVQSSFRLSVVCAAAVFAASCTGDLTATGDGYPHVASVQLSVGNTVYTIDRNGAVVGGPIVVRHGADVSVTAVFLRDSGLPETLATTAEYQLNVTVVVGSSALTYTPSTTNPFGGTLRSNGGAPSAGIRLTLHHVEEQKDYWGPFDAAVIMTN